MRHLARTVLTLTIAAILVAPVIAEEGKKKKKKKKRQQRGNAALRIPKKLQQALNDEQKTKIKALVKETAPKLQALYKKRVELVGREKLREANKARQEARKAKKNNREATKAFMEALALTAEQKDKWQAIQKEQRAITQGFRKSVGELLTDEQKKLLPGRGKKKRKKKKKNTEE